MAQKTTHRSGGAASGLLQRLLDAADSDNVKSVELNVNYTFDAKDGELREWVEQSDVEALEGEGGVEVERQPTPDNSEIPESFEAPEGQNGEEQSEQDSEEDDTSPVTRNTKEEVVMLTLYELGESTSTEINEVTGFTSPAKVSSTFIRLEEKDMVVRSEAPAESSCQYAFDLSALGRDWIDAFGRPLSENKYYIGDGD